MRSNLPYNFFQGMTAAKWAARRHLGVMLAGAGTGAALGAGIGWLVDDEGRALDGTLAGLGIGFGVGALGMLGWGMHRNWRMAAAEMKLRQAMAGSGPSGRVFQMGSAYHASLPPRSSLIDRIRMRFRKQ